MDLQDYIFTEILENPVFKGYNENRQGLEEERKKMINKLLYAYLLDTDGQVKIPRNNDELDALCSTLNDTPPAKLTFIFITFKESVIDEYDLSTNVVIIYFDNCTNGITLSATLGNQNFSYYKFKDGNFTNSILPCDFTGATFSNMNFTSTDFTGAIGITDEELTAAARVLHNTYTFKGIGGDEIEIIGTNIAPEITSGDTAEFAENGTGVVYTIEAGDADEETLIYSIEGTDAGLFNVNSSTGEITFKTPPDYENPADDNTDNVYEITVKASDGELEDTKAVAITVTEVNEKPVITSSAAVNFAEEGTGVAYTITISDPENDEIEYSISGGADAGLFSVNPTNGQVTFDVSPDYENPQDANTDNVYEITVMASDGELSDTKNVTITVTDIVE